jgi:hypothetical protein
MPALPPVTRATLPENCFVMFVSLATVENPSRIIHSWATASSAPGSSNKWVAWGQFRAVRSNDQEPTLTRRSDATIIVLASTLPAFAL